MSHFSDFLDMGGYAAYVWPSYGLTFLVLLLNIYWARRRFAQASEEARRRIAMRGEDR
jgi:heme exporter protein D